MEQYEHRIKFLIGERKNLRKQVKDLISSATSLSKNHNSFYSLHLTLFNEDEFIGIFSDTAIIMEYIEVSSYSPKMYKIEPVILDSFCQSDYYKNK